MFESEMNKFSIYCKNLTQLARSDATLYFVNAERKTQNIKNYGNMKKVHF